MHVLKLPPVVRLSIGLTLLAISLLLLADIFGLMPSKERAELQTRKVLTELLAVQIAGSISKGDLEGVSEQFEGVRNRYAEIASLGLRHIDKSLIHVSGEHESEWQSLQNSRATSRFVQVPIHNNGSNWANLEIIFHAPSSSLLGFFASQKTAAILILFGVFGFFANWMFLRRALNELDPSSVIPERVSAAFNVLTEGLVMLDRSGRIVLCNTAFENKTGLEAKQLISLRLSDVNWTPVVSDKQKSDIRLPWDTLLETGESGEIYQLLLETKTGGSVRFAVNTTTINTPDGVIRGAVVTFNDVTELANKNSDLERIVGELKVSQREISKKNRELDILATRDPLTGSLNRRSLFESMETLQSESKINGSLLSCIMVDIDHFKSINDNYGHAVGDDVIVMLSKVLLECVDASCLVGRYGGEEFVVALPGFSEEHAAQIAEGMRTSLSDGTHLSKNMPSKITASFGVASDSGGTISPGELVDLADKGLYVAKESGRNRVVRFSMRNDYSASSENESQNHDANERLLEKDGENSSEAEGNTLVNPDNKPLSDSLTVFDSDGADNTKNTLEYGSDVFLEDRVLQSIERSSRQKTHVAVVFAEVDVIEPVSSLEHTEDIDEIFKELSARVSKMFRSTDTVIVRPSSALDATGKSKFRVADIAIVLSDVKDVSSIIWLVRRISIEMEISLSVGVKNVTLESKMGISVYPGETEEPITLMANSRQALQEAVESEDSDSCRFYDRELNELASKTYSLERDLKHAIEHDEFSVVYQPLVELSGGRIEGFEVFIRWKNVHHGWVSPGQFIPIAEKIGVIDAINRWVFQETAAQLKSWHDAGFNELYLSINLSSVQFHDPDFLAQVSAIVEKADLTPQNFTLELTESSLTDESGTTVDSLSKLQDIGFNIALDDFGSDPASLLYLKTYSFDTVKIDRSFFIDFSTNARDTALVKAIISLSQSLGVKTVAEGVETIIQLDELLNLQCEAVQGYIFSEPLREDQAFNLLQNPHAISKKLNSLTGASDQSRNKKHSAISGVLNEIGVLDIEALSSASNQIRKLRARQKQSS